MNKPRIEAFVSTKTFPLFPKKGGSVCCSQLSIVRVEICGSVSKKIQEKKLEKHKKAARSLNEVSVLFFCLKGLIIITLFGKDLFNHQSLI